MSGCILTAHVRSYIVFVDHTLYVVFLDHTLYVVFLDHTLYVVFLDHTLYVVCLMIVHCTCFDMMIMIGTLYCLCLIHTPSPEGTR